MASRFAAEWPSLGVIEVDQRLVEDAAELAAAGDLRSLDALQLASARMKLTVATWDRRLYRARKLPLEGAGSGQRFLTIASRWKEE